MSGKPDEQQTHDDQHRGLIDENADKDFVDHGVRRHLWRVLAILVIPIQVNDAQSVTAWNQRVSLVSGTKLRVD
jgi:hypothetical protein